MGDSIDRPIDHQQERRLRRRHFLEVSALGLAAVAAPPFTRTTALAATGAISRGGTLRIGVPERFTGFDIFGTRSRTDYQATDNILDRLVTYDAHFVPRGMLAESWRAVDSTTWVFTLRSGVSFHDGTPFNAAAAAFSIDRLRQSPFKSQVARISRVSAVNDTTLEIKVSQPFPTLPAVLTQSFASIVSPTAYQKLGPAGFSKAPVGTGPFRFVSWNPSAELVLAANPHYWRTDPSGGRYPYVQKVVWKILPDVAAATLALQAGDVDLITTVSLPSVSQLASGPGTKVSETPTLGWNYIFLNTRTTPFNDVHKRRAVQYAIDRKAIVDAVLLGHGVPMLGPLPPNSWAYDPSITTKGLYGPHADVKKARQELAAAHAAGGFAFSLTYPTLDPFTGVAQAVKAQLAAVGITANLDGREIGTVLDNMFVSKFQALNIDWSGRIDEDLSTAAFYETKGANNFEQYSNPTVDGLLKQAGSITDRSRRAVLYHRAQALINADAPIILLFFPTQTIGLRSNVQGFQNLGDQRIPLYNVWLGAS